MSEEVQLAWKLSIAGAEEVKARLAEVHDQFNKGQLTVEQYGKELGKQNSTLRALTSNTAMQNRAWLASHPTINALSRTMSGFSRVLSATTTAMTAFNTAQLLMRTGSGDLVEAQNRLAEAERNYNSALSPEDKEKYARALAEAKTVIEGINAQTSTDQIQNIISFAVGIGSVAATSITAGIGLKGAGIGFGIFGAGAKAAAGGLRFLWAALGPVGLAMIALSIVIPLIIDNWDAITAAFSGFADYLSHTFAPVLKWLEENWKVLLIALTGGLGALVIFFGENWGAIQKGLEDAWNNITTGLTAFWNGFQTITTGAVDSVVKSVTGMVDGIVSAVRKALDWLAKLPGNVASGIGSLISGGSKSSSSGSSVKAGAAGLHDITNGPQMYLAGEGGVREEVSIKSIGRASTSGSAGGNVYVTIHNAGSVIAERDLENMIDEYGIRESRRRGLHPGI